MPASALRRLRSAAVALALTSAATGTAIAVAGPAHAVGADCSTIATIKVNGVVGRTVDGLTTTVAISYGKSVTVQASVALDPAHPCTTDAPPTAVDAGTLSIERSTDRGITWKRVTGASVDTSTGATTISKTGVSGHWFLPGLTEFRANFAGGTNADDDTFHASYNWIFAGPRRTLTRVAKQCTTTYCQDTFKVAPASSMTDVRVLLQRRVSGAWATVARRTVSSAGTFSYRFRLGTTRIVVPTANSYFGVIRLVTVSR
ncbi:MAG TPA: hypothetical protein VN088_00845 [Nocardioides sp.]|nr:hypothetical protein [Nocardioides sp.]